KVLVLPTTTRASAAAAAPPPPPQQIQNRLDTDTDIDLDEPADNPQGPPRPATFRPVPGGNGNQPTEGPDNDEPAPEATPPPSAAPGNPFGVVPGGARPGTINTPAPRNPSDPANTEQIPR